MKTARRYIGREIYRSCLVVIVALVGLFTFFSLVEKLDRVRGDFKLIHLLYLEALDLPTRLYDLLPIGLLIGAILALAGLAQRHELVILRVSGVSGMGLLRMLWRLTLPVVLGAVLLAELVVPAAEIRLGEANLQLLGKARGGRLDSGYWFKETTPEGSRIINAAELLASGNVRRVVIYEFDPEQHLRVLVRADEASFNDGALQLAGVTRNVINANTMQALADAKPTARSPTQVEAVPNLTLQTSLTPELLLARVLTPERMSFFNLYRYIDYLEANQIVNERQIVAVWRKLIYPFTLLVMIAIAAPVSFMQTRRGGVGAKVFVGILAGVGFFMLNQLALNAGMLYGWPAWVTAVVPNGLVLMLALSALVLMERRNQLALAWERWWPWRRRALN